MTELYLEIEELEERAVPAFIWIDPDTETPGDTPTPPPPPAPNGDGG